MAPTTLFAIGVFTVVLLAVFVYVSVRGVTHPPAEPPLFDELLRADPGEATHPLRILLAIDGSPCSVAAVNDVAHCRLPNGSAVKILNAIHSRVPVMFDPAFTLAAAARGGATRTRATASRDFAGGGNSPPTSPAAP
jgi:hypothetical protein